MTQSMKRQGEIRTLLAQNHIAYRLKTRGQDDSFTRANIRARTGSAGMDLEFQYTYTFYVHKNNYEEAMHLVNQ